MSDVKRLLKTVKYVGEMELVTGLSIMGNNNDLSIGGADSEVIKNPITGKPYIPGSSLKGKMRSLLELEKGKFFRKKDGRSMIGLPCNCGSRKCDVCVIFGAYQNSKASSAPTRIIVRDCVLTEESDKLIREIPVENVDFLEEKTENLVRRDTGVADSPRTIERVPAGLKFKVEIVLQIFEGDDAKHFEEVVDHSLKLLENNYLGGNGSRGSGQVKFNGEWQENEAV